MKSVIPVAVSIVVLLGLLAYVFFGGTPEPKPPPTPTAAPSPKVAFLSFHDRYVTAEPAGGSWLLTQEAVLDSCGWFTLRYLDNGRVALATCHDRYVTAPKTGATRSDWRLWQEPEFGECGQFVLHNLGRDGFALETCAGHFLTAGDNGEGWSGELAWAVVGETDTIDEWEWFKLLQPYTPLLSVITNFDSSGEPAKHGRKEGVVHAFSSGDRMGLSYVQAVYLDNIALRRK